MTLTPSLAAAPAGLSAELNAHVRRGELDAHVRAPVH